MQPFRELETKVKAEGLRKMFPNGMQPLRELDTKAKAVSLRKMFLNGMQAYGS
jgi:hypothetical protein